MADRVPRTIALGTSKPAWSIAARQILPLVLLATGLWILWSAFQTHDFTSVFHSLSLIAPVQWALALAATAGSFWAIGRYDGVIHGLLGTPVGTHAARRSGACAIAVAQFAGFGVLTGALVRWKMLPGLTFLRAFQLSLTVSASFLFGLAIVASATIAVVGHDLPYHGFAAPVLLVISVGLLTMMCLPPRWSRRLPPVRAIITVSGLVLIDMAFAACALYALIPGEVAANAGLFFAVFILASAAGLIFGTPGGVGPFEMTLLALLPHGDATALLAAALAFRIVYHVIPASIAVRQLFLTPEAAYGSDSIVKNGPASAYLAPDLEGAIWGTSQPELNFVRQGQFSVLTTNSRPSHLVAHTGQSMLFFREPVGRDSWTNADLNRAKAIAARGQRRPFVYKCNARSATFARAAGWATLPIVREAVVTPATYSADGSARRQLRRQLRKAEAENLTIRHAGRDLPLLDMGRVADDWAGARGGERGFTMGRFDEAYVQTQSVFLAYRGNDLVAFLTFNETRTAWSLDLMRQSTNAPAGTMHLLLHRALLIAKNQQIETVSLAGVPVRQTVESRIAGWCEQRFHAKSGGDGLHRFKDAFAPRWVTLYAAAPGPVSLSIGLIEVFREIIRPA